MVVGGGGFQGISKQKKGKGDDESSRQKKEGVFFYLFYNFTVPHATVSACARCVCSIMGRKESELIMEIQSSDDWRELMIIRSSSCFCCCFSLISLASCSACAHKLHIFFQLLLKIFIRFSSFDFLGLCSRHSRVILSFRILLSSLFFIFYSFKGFFHLV